MQVKNIIAECDDGKPATRDLDGVRFIALHRIWFDDWLPDRPIDPIEIARRFVDDPEIANVTGGESPYSLLLDREGVWWQCLALADTGRHARRWNTAALGIGVIGDFRRLPPPPAQRAALVDGLAQICPALCLRPTAGGWLGHMSAPLLAGHDELPGGSTDPSKRCPGLLLSMPDLRRDVAIAIEQRAMRALKDCGVVL